MARLIDADKVYTIIVDEMWDADDLPHDEQQAVLSACRSIKGRIEKRAQVVDAIPIDKPFLKMRYGDYVVYNKKWLVDHLQTEWDILQGKEYQPSIPVEWIKKWCNKEHNRKSLEERLLKRYGVIMMLEDWEKENEESSNRD